VSSLQWIKVWIVTPDMLLAALVYLASGIILRIRAEGTTLLKAALLGFVLGIGYLAKSVMFILSFFFLFVAFKSANSRSRAGRALAVSLAVFFLVAGPFLLAISLSKGRFTFGESGRLTYAWNVTGINPMPAHWQGEPLGNGTPLHPTRKLLNQPALYEFSNPIRATYPPWYDPSFWHEGLEIKFNLGNQLGQLFSNCIFYLDFLIEEQSALLIVTAMLFLVGTRLLTEYRYWKSFGLVAVTAVTLGAYALVYVETRYLAPFMVIGWRELLAAPRSSRYKPGRKLTAILSCMVLVFLWAKILVFNLEGFCRMAISEQAHTKSSGHACSPFQVTETLEHLGIQEGAKVGVIGYAIDSRWAKLAKLQIVAEIPTFASSEFWGGSSDEQIKALRAFEGAGAVAVLAEDVPDCAVTDGWVEVAYTDCFVYVLNSQSAPSY
jgi:hypothetical protein